MHLCRSSWSCSFALGTWPVYNQPQHSLLGSPIGLSLMKRYLIKWKLSGKWISPESPEQPGCLHNSPPLIHHPYSSIHPQDSSLFLISMLGGLWCWIAQDFERCSEYWFFSCESAWSQATLPVCFDGTGVRRASQLAPSAFLASAVGSYDSSTKFYLFSFLAVHT